jgi:hypothetical protein
MLDLTVMALCAKCKGVMNRDYRCIGCDKSIHWFCSEGGEQRNESLGHGAHYWCSSGYQTSNNPTVPITQDAVTDGVLASLGSPLSAKSCSKTVQFLLMSDKMRYGNLSSPNQWNARELPSSHEHDYFPDIDEEPYEEDTDEDNAFIGSQEMTGSSNIPSPSIYITNY